jgi:hypothetical protein
MRHINSHGTGVTVISILAIVISLASAGFSAFVYFNTPKQIDSYVLSHKEMLKGEDGQDGANGINGRNGSNGTSSSNSLSCSTYSSQYSNYSSTNCY